MRDKINADTKTLISKGKIMSKKANDYIKTLNLIAHPEGGYYAETYSSPLTHDANGKNRPLATSIYFLLGDTDVSKFHQLQSDELWYFHDGAPLDVYMILESGELKIETLGLDLKKGQRPQLLVPAGSIFGSCMHDSEGADFSLVGCVVSYGFHFDDFKLFSQEELMEIYPNYKETIIKLT